MNLPAINSVIDNIGKMKILHLLSHYEELNITRVSKLTKINHKRVRSYIENLKEYSIIQEKRFGRISILKLNTNNQAGLIFKEFFKKWELNSK